MATVLGVPRPVEVGPIWNNDDAIPKAQQYLSQHPGEAWTGSWTTTRPGEMSVLSMVKYDDAHNEYIKDVDVGPCANNLDAGKHAQQYLASHPNENLAWTGAWTSRGGTSVINIVKYHP